MICGKFLTWVIYSFFTEFSLNPSGKEIILDIDYSGNSDLLAFSTINRKSKSIYTLGKTLRSPPNHTFLRRLRRKKSLERNENTIESSGSHLKFSCFCPYILFTSDKRYQCHIQSTDAECWYQVICKVYSLTFTSGGNNLGII